MNITEVLRIYIDLRGRVEKHESKIWQVRQGKFWENFICSIDIGSINYNVLLYKLLLFKIKFN